MIAANKYQNLLDHCCGKVPKPYVKPILTGIEKHERDLDFIDDEYQKEFSEKKV